MDNQEITELAQKAIADFDAKHQRVDDPNSMIRLGPNQCSDIEGSLNRAIARKHGTFTCGWNIRPHPSHYLPEGIEDNPDEHVWVDFFDEHIRSKVPGGWFTTTEPSNYSSTWDRAVLFVSNPQEES